MTWKGKTQGSVLGYKIFVYILKNLGLQVAYFMLRFVILYYLIFSVKSTKAIFSLFRNRLKYSLVSSLSKVYSTYFIFGQTLIDKIAMMGGLDNKFSIDHEGVDHLQDIASGNTGGIFISGHLGNYEMAGHLLKRLNTTINIVMYDAEHEKIKDYLSEIYGERPVNIIPVKPEGMDHIFEINNALRRKEIVCMHGDRFPPGSKTTICDFLGKEAHFPIGPFLLIEKLKVPYSYVFAVKESDTHYHFFASPPKIAESMSASDILSEYVLHLETMVVKYPEQWFNFYDFWQKAESPAQDKKNTENNSSDKAA